MSSDNLDRALAEEFADRASEIHALKAKDPAFRDLLHRNHELWEEIQRAQNGIEPTSDERLEQLERRRLALLDEITLRLDTAGA